jgi:hypothetical protein
MRMGRIIKEVPTTGERTPLELGLVFGADQYIGGGDGTST